MGIGHGNRLHYWSTNIAASRQARSAKGETNVLICAHPQLRGAFIVAETQNSGRMDSKADLGREEKDPKKAEVIRWKLELQNAESVFSDYHKRADAIIERYRDERSESDGTKNQGRRYNALWSMKETLKPLLYAQSPTPYVARFHDDEDSIARDASLVLQRALAIKTDNGAFYDALSEAVDDYILLGRGTTWVTYLPVFAVRESEVPTYLEPGEEPPEDDLAEVEEGEDRPRYKTSTDERGDYYRKKIEYKAQESCVLESVSSKDLLHGPATTWRHVPWVARRVPMLREELVKRFGKRLGEKVPLSAKENTKKRHMAANTDDFKGQFNRGVVWEVWDRVNGEILWLCPDVTESVLDKKSDILKLESFFPCAKPMFGTMTNDSLIAIPDYTEWQDIALELDDVTFRISLLTSALRVAGCYSKEYGDDIKKLVTGTRTNEMIAVDNWAMFAEKGGLKGAVDFMPLDQVTSTLKVLYDVRGRLVQELYEITGISDIVRGASDPRETASAQKLKGSFANARLTSRQKAVARHAAETLGIFAEIVCSLYSDQNIFKLCAAESIFKTPEGMFDTVRWNMALALLRNEPMRTLRVRISTDTLSDEGLATSREEASQFLTAVGGYLQNASQMIQVEPGMGPLLAKMLMFSVRKFKVGRELEAELDTTLKQMAKAGVGQGKPGEEKADSGMNEREHQIETQRLQLDRDRLEVDKEKNAIEREKLALAKLKIDTDSGLKGKEVQIKGYSAMETARLKDKQIDTTAQTQLAQQSMQARQADNQAARDDRKAEHEIALSERESSHDMEIRTAEFVAGRSDQEQGTQERAEDRKLAAKQGGNK